ncbi:mCG1040940, isoform CRA_b [Mus musculus]|nr:mCG1040940, isoform CRA_b [Mus musculus]
MFVCLCACHARTDAHGGQKRALNPRRWTYKLQNVGPGTEFGYFTKTICTLNHEASVPAPNSSDSHPVLSSSHL